MDTALNSGKVVVIDIENIDDLYGIEGTMDFTFPDYEDQNSTRPEYTVNLDDHEEVDVALTFFRLLIFIVGILGNLLVIFVILILAEYRKAVTHWYVLQLAIADSIFLLTLPLRTAEQLQSQWRNLEWMCKLKDTVMFLNYYSSICFLVVMSIDRYIAVCHWRPTSILQKLRTPTAAGIITMCVWIGCLLMCIPVILYSTTKGMKPHCDCQFVFPQSTDPQELCRKESGGDQESYDYCMEHAMKKSDQGHCIEEEDYSFSGASGFDLNDALFTDAPFSPTGTAVEPSTATLLNPGCHYFQYAQGFLVFLWFNFIVMFIIPLIIMIVCYTFIVNRLNVTRIRGETVSSHNSTSRPGSVSSNGRKRSSSRSKSDRNRTRVTIMCASMVVLFVICWLPFHAVHLAKMKSIHGTTEFCAKLSQVVSLIAIANSMLNPIVYNFVGTRFVKRLRSVRDTRSVKAFLHFTSGITTANGARHNSTSGTDQMNDKSAQKQRWRSEAAPGDREITGHSAAVHYKVSNDAEESRAELMKKYPIYTGPTAQQRQRFEGLSRDEPPPYPEQQFSITTENDPMITEEVTVKQEQ